MRIRIDGDRMTAEPDQQLIWTSAGYPGGADEEADGILLGVIQR